MTGSSALTAVILAAGFGTRLRPLSYQVPKPLFPILNRPLLGLILSQLENAGFKRVAVNAHHLAADIKLYVETQNQWNLEIFLSFEAEILGTGGGLRHMADFIGDSPFLVINGDILTDLNFAEVYHQHRQHALATMILHDYPRFNNVWLAEDGQVAAFGLPPAGPRPIGSPGFYRYPGSFAPHLRPDSAQKCMSISSIPIDRPYLPEKRWRPQSNKDFIGRTSALPRII